MTHDYTVKLLIQAPASIGTSDLDHPACIGDPASNGDPACIETLSTCRADLGCHADHLPKFENSKMHSATFGVPLYLCV